MCNCNSSIDFTKSYFQLSTRADDPRPLTIKTNLELVLIGGSIKNASVEHPVLVKINNESETVPVVNKAFKFLSRLDTNQTNLVKIQHCQEAHTFQIIHESPTCVTFDVQPIYIVPAGCSGKFQTTLDDTVNEISDALVKIDLAMELCRSIISAKVNSGSEKSFVLQKSIVFHSKMSVEKAQSLDQWELYDLIADELKSSDLFRSTRKFVGFISCTRFDGLQEGEEYSYENIRTRTSANPSLGGDFLCLLGSGTMYSWPLRSNDVISAFENTKRVDLKQVLDDSNYRCTYGGCFSTSLGSLIHEVGHIFDLAHTETGLMGNDIDFVHRMFLNRNVTEKLPPRTVRKCETARNDKTNRNPASFKLTKLKKPGSEFLDTFRKQKNHDMTFLEENCAVTLRNHNWFTQNSEKSEIAFEMPRKLVRSTSPLKLVELRELESNNSLLIKFWSLEDKNLNEFRLPEDVSLRNVVVFAINEAGGILKEKFGAA